MSAVDAALAEVVKTAVAEAVAEALADLANRPVVCTKTETAALLRCSPSQIDKWLTVGLLPRMPHTSKVLIPRVAIEAFATGQLEQLRSVS